MTAETTAATDTVDTSTAATTTTAAATDSTQSTDAQETPQATETSETTTTTEGEQSTDAIEYTEFSIPEGMTLDQAALDRAIPVFKAQGLTQDQAQALVAHYAAEIKALGDGSAEAAEKWYAERKAGETAQQSAEWLEATKADKEIGGAQFDAVKSRVIEAIGAVATPEAKQAFNDLGWGNHPELIRLVNRLIDYTPQDRGERPAGAGGTQGGDIASRMYPGMA